MDKLFSKVTENKINEQTTEDEQQELLEIVSEADMIAYINDGSNHSGLPDNSDISKLLDKSTSIEENITNQYDGTLRGWYGEKNRPRWCPQQSKFKARGGKHNGVDIAMLKGTKLMSLVHGRMQWNPNNGPHPKLGNYIWLNFTLQGNRYTFVYAHLDNKIGTAPRNVSAGEEVAIAGCSGNTVYCGSDNCVGRREDHVHIILYGPNGLMDPVPFVGWKLRYYDDDDCYFLSCP